MILCKLIWMYIIIIIPSLENALDFRWGEDAEQKQEDQIWNRGLKIIETQWDNKVAATITENDVWLLWYW